MANYKIYLEFEEEEINGDIGQIGIDNEDELLLEADDFNKKQKEQISNIFLPIYLYRRPMSGTLGIDIDFDPQDYSILHVVIRHFSYVDSESEIFGKWEVVKVCATRREALDTKYILENEDFVRKGCTIEENMVYSLGVED